MFEHSSSKEQDIYVRLSMPILQNGSCFENNVISCQLIAP